MKKLAIAVAVALSSGTAHAGMYHSGSTNICADCHTMHSSMAHDYLGGSSVSATPRVLADGSWLPSSGVPADFLLKGEGGGVCVTCHDGRTWAPDVIGTNTNAYARSAGSFPSIPGNGHTLGFTGNIPGGAGSVIGTTVTDFTCTDCHSPHGKADAFRNLNPTAIYSVPGSRYPRFYLSATAFDPAGAGRSDVRIDAVYAQGTGDAAFSSHIPYYSNARVHYENGDTNALDAFCGACHGQFHNDSTVATDLSSDLNQIGSQPGVFRRHPTRVAITQAAGGGFTTKVFARSDGRVFVGCLSCHRAHGTENPFALFYATGAVVGGPNALDDTENGAGGYGGSCSNCHAQAQ